MGSARPAPATSRTWTIFPPAASSVAEDIRDLFTRNFYFGCEADDPINAWAFNSRVNPYKARIKTLLGSDIGHFDVVNMNEVLEEAYELVEDGLITEEDFREFVFLNPLRFWAEGGLTSSRARFWKAKPLPRCARRNHRSLRRRRSMR